VQRVTSKRGHCPAEIESAPDPEAIGNSIRERMNNTADRRRDAAAGHGALADPEPVDLLITLTLTVLEAAQAQLRRDVLNSRRRD
jgi:hypothetical protein